MKIFDTHTHVYPDKIAAQVVAKLAERSNHIPYYTDGTYDDLKAHALAAGYTGWMNLPVATRPGQAKSLNAWAAEHNHWPSLSLGGLHPDDENPEDLLKYILDLGLHGVKFHPEYQSFYLDEPRMERIWTLCEKLELPVLLHASYDIGFPGPYHSTPADFAELARRHPGLTLIAAHTGGWLDWERVENDLAGAELYIDTSFTIQFLKDKSQFERIVRKHGVKKVLFGTDSPWQDLPKSIAEIKEQPFSQSELEDIFWNNAARVWGKRAPEFFS